MKPKIVKKPDNKPKKQKPQQKRMKTFSSSQFSLCQQKNKPLQGSATDLTILKQQLVGNRRAQNNSAMSQYNNIKLNTTRLVVKKKKKSPKKKLKIKKIDEQQFEKVKYKQSNSQSQIVFSNDETKRQSCISIKDVRYIESISNYEADSNLVLRVNIKKQYVRKVEAATKIQKVFRGFMTRKILMKYVTDEEEKIKNQLGLNDNSEQYRQNQTNRTFVNKQGDNLLNKLFQNKAVADINFNHTIRPRTEYFQTNQNQSQSPNDEKKDKKSQGKQARGKISERQANKIWENWMEKENKRAQEEDEDEQQQQQSQEQEQEQEDDETNLIYKRQNPIYSQQEISQYLQSSSQAEEQIDEYEPQIIFETNEEYIQSRKSSLQNKNQTINKLSNKGMGDLALLNLPSNDDKIRKQLRDDHCLIKVNRKKDSVQHEQLEIVQQQVKQIIESSNKLDQNINLLLKQAEKEQKNQQTVKKLQSQQIDMFETVEVNFEQQKQPQKPRPKAAQIQIEKPDSQNINIKNEQIKKQSEKLQKNSIERVQYSPRRQIKYLDQQYVNSNSSQNSSRSRMNKSRLSAQQNQIVKLRELECEKWDEVIRMVSQQIRKSNENNEEIVSFMKNIMEFSQKNKQLLGSTRSVNSQSESLTTPTSMGIHHAIQNKERVKSVGLPGYQEKQQDQLQSKQKQQDGDGSCKFFKKKKPLKIDILESNFLQQQRQSIISQKSEKNLKNNKFDFLKQKQFVRSNRKREDFSDKLNYDFINEQGVSIAPLKKSMKNQIEDSLQNSKTLKKFLTTNIQVQDQAIYDILKLRQELLQKRESEELVKLNNLLSKNQLSQQDFLQSLSQLTRRFVQQKQSIDKAKQDILKGYQAANNLVKQYFYDVRRMGIKLAVSKSQDNLKYKFTQTAYLNDIKIDELTPKSTPKSGKRVSVKQIFADHQIYEGSSKQKSSNVHQNNFESSEDSSIDFTEQQLKRFRKAANYDLQFNDLNRNMTTISDDFIKQQKKCFQQEQSLISCFNQSPDNIKNPRSIQPQRETYQLQESKIPSTRTPPHIEAIIENEMNMLMWELVAQLMLRPQIAQKFIERPSVIKPEQVTIDERIQFLKILEQNFPDNNSLHRKLNQNISPLPSQILKCMRLDFSEQPDQENDDENYEEINRYQFVISQEACAKSVMLFKNSLDQAEERKQIASIQKYNQLFKSFEQGIKNTFISQKIQKFVSQRQKFLKNKKQHTRQLRWEVMNIELHCIFDSWNQQIIQICSARPGFSGIGLNELTLSMINHNKAVPEQRCQPIVKEAKQKVIQILTDDTDIATKFQRQNFYEMCQTDSAWIFYADQALSYALELVYLVEEDIYSQMAKQFRKIITKNSLFL